MSDAPKGAGRAGPDLRKRFYKGADITPVEGGWSVVLDARPCAPRPRHRWLCRARAWPG
ncbi:hypothetical protein ACFQ4K_07995 [Tistrella bauzanensis]